MADDMFRSRAHWSLQFAFFPTRCELSGRLIWLRYAYKGTAWYTGPGLPVAEIHWRDRHEHLIWSIKHESV